MHLHALGRSLWDQTVSEKQVKGGGRGNVGGEGRLCGLANRDSSLSARANGEHGLQATLSSCLASSGQGVAPVTSAQVRDAHPSRIPALLASAAHLCYGPRHPGRQRDGGDAEVRWPRSSLLSGGRGWNGIEGST